MKKDLRDNFEVTVIIPVYNCEKFIEKAVDSVVNLFHVREILLVEDNSPDNALEICRALEKSHKKVRLLRHPNGENRGASASRNLGILESTYDFVAFLDADDWYLPSRFNKDQEVFSKYPNADVVYSSVKEEGHANSSMKNVRIKDAREVVGIDASPKEFYHYSIAGKQQHPAFHTNSVTIRKSFLLEGKLFDERLRLHQDSELWKRLLRRGNFYPGVLEEPVAIIRKHEDNRITSRTADSRLKMYAIFIDNIGVENLFNFEKKYLLEEILRTKSNLISNSWKRRYVYYSSRLFSVLNKKEFLRKFSMNYLLKSG